MLAKGAGTSDFSKSRLENEGRTMAFMTKYGKLLQLNMFHGLVEEGEIDRDKPAYEGQDTDLMNMHPGSTITTNCPLGCGVQIMLLENTVGALDDALQGHFKECKNNSPLPPFTQGGYLLSDLRNLVNEFNWSATVPKARIIELLRKYGTGMNI